jgi:hypothetical protein
MKSNFRRSRAVVGYADKLQRTNGQPMLQINGSDVVGAVGLG